jgi:hypothetical protein
MEGINDMRLNKDQLIDILERAVFTYVQTFLGLMTASGMGIDTGGISTLKMAALGGIPAALSVIKGAICAGGPIGDSTASVMKQKPTILDDAEEQLYN